jgi:ubiquinone/menaquinone biosynthesis C-methylase UbiE
MTKTTTSEYYNFHWATFANFNYPGVKVEKVQKFFKPVKDKLLIEKDLLDVGSGDGTHWYYLKNILELPIIYHGIDISEKSVQFLNNSSSDLNSSFQTMDACQLDFPDGSFDIVFAYGVIGYTDNPQKAVEEMFRVCKPNGIVGVFSPEITGFSRFGLQLLRSLAGRLSNKGKSLLAALLVPFFGFIPSETRISLKNASWKQIREVILTDIAPPQLTLLSHDTITSLFSNNGFEIFSDDKEIPSSVWGKRIDAKC